MPGLGADDVRPGDAQYRDTLAAGPGLGLDLGGGLDALQMPEIGLKNVPTSIFGNLPPGYVCCGCLSPSISWVFVGGCDHGMCADCANTAFFNELGQLKARKEAWQDKLDDHEGGVIDTWTNEVVAHPGPEPKPRCSTCRLEMKPSVCPEITDDVLQDFHDVNGIRASQSERREEQDPWPELDGELDWRPDRRFNSVTEQHTVVCTHHAEGCTWQGKLTELKAHIQMNCDYTTVDCPNLLCVPCADPENPGTMKSTPGEPVFSGKRFEVKHHCLKDCPGRTVGCELGAGCCDWTGPFCELEAHMKTDHANGFRLYVRKTTQLTMQLVSKLDNTTKDLGDMKTIMNRIAEKVGVGKPRDSQLVTFGAFTTLKNKVDDLDLAITGEEGINEKLSDMHQAFEDGELGGGEGAAAPVGGGGGGLQRIANGAFQARETSTSRKRRRQSAFMGIDEDDYQQWYDIMYNEAPAPNPDWKEEMDESRGGQPEGRRRHRHGGRGAAAGAGPAAPGRGRGGGIAGRGAGRGRGR